MGLCVLPCQQGVELGWGVEVCSASARFASSPLLPTLVGGPLRLAFVHVLGVIPSRIGLKARAQNK